MIGLAGMFVCGNQRKNDDKRYVTRIVMFMDTSLLKHGIFISCIVLSVVPTLVRFVPFIN